MRSRAVEARLEELLERRSPYSGHRLERSRPRGARSPKTGSRTVFGVLGRRSNSHFVRTNVRRMQRRKRFVRVVHLCGAIGNRSNDRRGRTQTCGASHRHAGHIATWARCRESPSGRAMRYVQTNPGRVRHRLADPFVCRRRGKPFAHDIARRAPPRSVSRTRCVVVSLRSVFVQSSFSLRRRSDFRSLANDSQPA
jgi:hypothetical protein